MVQSPGLAAGDKIQLILGLAISLPSTVGTIFAAIYGYRAYRNRHPKAPAVNEAEQPIELQQGKVLPKPNPTPEVLPCDTDTGGGVRSEMQSAEVMGGVEIEEQVVPGGQSVGTEESVVIPNAVDFP